jgi:hypothetical protein
VHVVAFQNVEQGKTMTDPNPELPPSLDQVETLSGLLRIGKDEMNLAEFPMTSLSDRPVAGETSLKFEDQIYDDRKKKVILRKRIIEGSKEYGLPTATDDAVILALIQLTKIKNAFTAREVDFTRHELINLLQWPNKGQSYDRIALSLHRLAGVTYHFENSWWDNRRKAWTSKIFGIIDNVDLNDSRETDGQGTLFTSRIVWNQTVLDSFQAGYLRSIDFQLAMSFKHIISMRIYRFMGKRFHLQPEWTFAIRDFACEHIGLARNYEGGVQLVRKLKPAIVELEGVGFLAPLPEQERFTKKGRDWFIRLIQHSPALAVPASPSPASQAAMPLLVSALVQRGVTKSVAADLVQRHAAELIERQMEVFDWLVEKQDKKVAQNPAGYLVESIRTPDGGYQVPKGFVSRAEQQAREKARQAQEREQAEQRRRQREQAACERALRDEADAYIKQLTPEKRRALEAEVLAEASAETRQSYAEAGPAQFRATLLLGLMREHVAQKLLRKAIPAGGS